VSHLQRVVDIVLAGEPALAGVSHGRPLVRPGDQLTVGRGQMLRDAQKLGDAQLFWLV